MVSRANNGNSGQRALKRGAVVGVLASLTAATLALGVACLPSLSPIADAPTPVEGSTTFVGCGDGLIATLDDGGDAGESCDPGKPNDPDAQAPGCSACRIVCEKDGVIDPRTGHCYFPVDPSDNYPAAITSCKARGAHVVTFASAAEVTLVQGVTGGAGASGFWVGLSRSSELGEAYGPDRPEEPGFPFPAQQGSPGPAGGPCEGCFGVGADPDGGTFRIDNPGSAPDTRCVASLSGSWAQVPCRGPARATLCEREPVGVRAQPCFGGYCFTLPATAGRKSYLVSFLGADLAQAVQSCAQLPGGSLVVLDSAEEREQLGHEILIRDDTLVQQELWIGVVQDGGTWTWEDGVPLASSPRPLPWGNAQPAGARGIRAFMRLAATAYDTQLAYADDGSAPPRVFVCQRSAQ